MRTHTLHIDRRGWLTLTALQALRQHREPGRNDVAVTMTLRETNAGCASDGA